MGFGTGISAVSSRYSQVRRSARWGAWAILAAALFSTRPALATDTTHVVEHGHTLQAIAARYHVSVDSIVKANHLEHQKTLKVGETLVIPDVPKAGLPKPHEETTKKAKDDPKGKDGKKEKDGKKKKEKPVTFAMRARTPGVVHIHRLATKEDFTVRVREGGKVPASASKIFARLLRSATGQTHPIEPRTIALLGTVSDHFGSRKVEVISGYRPFRDTQSTRHSKHNDGKAVDFRIVGVPNEVLRDYVKTLKNVGVGYYPNSVFVHMDARESPAFWIDYSRPGEPPRYHSPDADADEGTSDIVEDDEGKTNLDKEVNPPSPEGAEPAVPSPAEGIPTPPPLSPPAIVPATSASPPTTTQPTAAR